MNDAFKQSDSGSAQTNDSASNQDEISAELPELEYELDINPTDNPEPEGIDQPLNGTVNKTPEPLDDNNTVEHASPGMVPLSQILAEHPARPINSSQRSLGSILHFSKHRNQFRVTTPISLYKRAVIGGVLGGIVTLAALLIL